MVPKRWPRMQMARSRALRANPTSAWTQSPLGDVFWPLEEKSMKKPICLKARLSQRRPNMCCKSCFQAPAAALV
eukprot:2121854-Lingulodinium_polyedra.AAC.1